MKCSISRFGFHKTLYILIQKKKKNISGALQQNLIQLSCQMWFDFYLICRKVNLFTVQCAMCTEFMLNIFKIVHNGNIVAQTLITSFSVTLISCISNNFHWIQIIVSWLWMLPNNKYIWWFILFCVCCWPRKKIRNINYEYLHQSMTFIINHLEKKTLKFLIYEWKTGKTVNHSTGNASLL